MIADVSVVIPCYNCAPYVSQALCSVLAQSVKPAEVILVDDASTDGSAEVAHQAAAGSFEYVRVAHRNLAAVRNEGIRRASGRWIAFLDADDFWYEEHLSRALRVLHRGGCVAYRSLFDQVDNMGRRFRPRWSLTAEEDAFGLSTRDYFRLARAGLPNCPGTYVISRTRLLEVGGFNPKFRRRQDIDGWIRAIEGHSWALGAYVAMGYRANRPGSLSRNVPERNRFELEVLLDARSRNGSIPDLDALIEGAAWRTVATAATRGTKEDQERARRIAVPELHGVRRAYASLLLRVPACVSVINSIRRRGAVG